MGERTGRRRFAAPVSLGVVLGAVLVFGVLVLTPRLLGWQPLTIVSGSMAPTVSPGDVVVIDPVTAWPVPAGTVVTYRQPQTGVLVTHRVVAVDLVHRAYLTRGDANPVNDSLPVPADAVLGRVRLLVPMAGLPTLLPGAHLFIPVVLIGLGAAAGWGLHRHRHRHRVRPRTPVLVAGRCLVAATAGVAPGGVALRSSTAQFTGTTSTSVSLGTRVWSVFTMKARDLGPVSYWPLEDTGTTAADNAWHFYAGTWDGSASRIYRDGVAGTPAPVTSPGQIVSISAPVTIGAPSKSTSAVAQVDEVAIWDRALTPSEISGLYTAGIS